MTKIYKFLLIFMMFAGPVVSQTADIYFDADESYSQRDTFFVVSVKCDVFFNEVKAIRLDIDVNPSVLSFDTTKSGSDTIFVKPGGLLIPVDTVTFFSCYLHPDSTRITIDIALLSDSATINGPGELVRIPITTVGFGESDIVLVNAFLIDRFGNEIPATTNDSWAKVCQFVGDVNADNRIDIADLVYFVDYSFGIPSGPPPNPFYSGDVDCSGYLDIADIVYLVTYMFDYGPPPCEVCL